MRKITKTPAQTDRAQDQDQDPARRKRLSLHRETLRTLAAADLQRAAGGVSAGCPANSSDCF